MNFLLSGSNVLGAGKKGKIEKRKHFFHYGDVAYPLYPPTPTSSKASLLFDELQQCKLYQSIELFIL